MYRLTLIAMAAFSHSSCGFVLIHKCCLEVPLSCYPDCQNGESQSEVLIKSYLRLGSGGPNNRRVNAMIFIM